MQQNKKRQHGNGAVWKKCNLKREQHEKNTTRKKINCHSETRKNAQENYTIVHKRITGG